MKATKTVTTFDAAAAQTILASVIDPKEVGLIERADALIQLRNEFGVKYLDLCSWVRSNAIMPKTVSKILLAKGFNRQRVSEINRISQCSDELWDEYKAGQLGRNAVLLLERGAVETENVANVEGGEAVDKPEDGDGSGSDKDKPEKTPQEKDEAKKLRMSLAAKFILNAGEHFNLRSKKWTLNNGWTLELRRESKAERDAKMKAAKSKGEKEGDE